MTTIEIESTFSKIARIASAIVSGLLFLPSVLIALFCFICAALTISTAEFGMDYLLIGLLASLCSGCFIFGTVLIAKRNRTGYSVAGLGFLLLSIIFFVLRFVPLSQLKLD